MRLRYPPCRWLRSVRGARESGAGGYPPCRWLRSSRREACPARCRYPPCRWLRRPCPSRCWHTPRYPPCRWLRSRRAHRAGLPPGYPPCRRLRRLEIGLLLHRLSCPPCRRLDGLLVLPWKSPLPSWLGAFFASALTFPVPYGVGRVGGYVMRKLILALVAVVMFLYSCEEAFSADRYGDAPKHAVFLGQILGALEACQKADTDLITAVSGTAVGLLSPDKETNTLVLYSFASGAFHQGKHQMEGTSEITCDEAVSLAKSLIKK